MLSSVVCESIDYTAVAGYCELTISWNGTTIRNELLLLKWMRGLPSRDETASAVSIEKRNRMCPGG